MYAEITHTVNVLADVATYATTSTSSDGDWLKLLPLLSGPAYFAFMYARYRNKDKRHHHENETSAHLVDVTGSDEKFKRITGTSASRVSGENSRSVRAARN